MLTLKEKIIYYVKRMFQKEEHIRIIAMHKNVSRTVRNEDIQRVIIDADRMQQLCFMLENEGVFQDVYALAHSQVVKKNPLRFFILNQFRSRLQLELGEPDTIIINPKIIRHTNVAVEKAEGCVTFPYHGNVVKQRYHKIEAEYQTYEVQIDGKMIVSAPKVVALSGLMAQIFQHEIDHFDGKYIYDTMQIPKKVLERAMPQKIYADGIKPDKV